MIPSDLISNLKRLIVLSVLVGLQLVVAQPTVIEYSLPVAPSGPQAITKGPDGNLWIARTGANRIAKVTPEGVVTDYTIPTIDSKPAGITAGPDGNVWFTETTGNKIGRITPNGVITEFPLPTELSMPTSITSGPDGNIWFIEQGGQTAIGKITTSGSVTEYPGPGFAYGHITAGPDGNVWFSAYTRIGKITPSGAITFYTGMPGIQAITLGSAGNLWAIGSSVCRISVNGTLLAEYWAPISPSARITAAPDGNLWINGSVSKLTKMKIDGTSVEYATPIFQIPVESLPAQMEIFGS